MFNGISAPSCTGWLRTGLICCTKNTSLGKMPDLDQQQGLARRGWNRGLMQNMSGDSDVADEGYRKLEAWRQRHCISSAAEGGLFPEIYLRRFMDDSIEVSWTGRSPLFAPSGFSFQAGAGSFNCSVSAVVEAFWGALQWAVHNPPTLEYESFKDDWKSLCQKVAKAENS